MIMYFILPIILSVVYVKNMQGRLRSCFVYTEEFEVIGKVDNIEKKKINRNLKIQFILLILSMIIMIMIICVFLMTENNLNNTKSNAAILKIHLLR